MTIEHEFDGENWRKKIMLKDLNYYTTEPSHIYAMIAQINGIDLTFEKAYFEHYTTGVYRHDGYMFNFDGFINERCP